MTKKRKQVTMLVTVSGPAGMSAAQARRNVRDLINDQCFSGSIVAGDMHSGFVEIDEYTFCARSVRPAGKL